jgi:VCBS repeat-containing protein
VANDDAYATNEDITLNVAPVLGVLANDTDADSDPLTAVLQTSVSNGSLTLNPNGSFTYTPDPNFNGSDSFTYVANDGSVDSNIATVTITVNAVNDVPVADTGGPYTGVAGIEVSFDGSGSSDVDGTIVSYDWDFGDGGSHGSSPGSGVNPTHVYARPDTYFVTLTVTDDGGATRTEFTTATIAPGAPVCEVSPTALDFGSTDIGTSMTLATTITHTGTTGRCAVQSIVFDNPEFARLSPSVPFNVWAGTSRDVVVQYAPVDVGADAGVMSITIGDPQAAVINIPVNLTGTGGGTPTPTPTPTATPGPTPTPTATPTPAPTPPQGEVCVVSPTTLNFGTTDVGTTVALSAMVSHTGPSGRCTVQATSFDNPEFSRLSPSVPFNVWMGTSRSITVQYAPVDAGADANTMTITIRRPDGTTATATVALSGAGSGTPTPTPTPTPTSTPGPTPTPTPTPGPTATPTPTPTVTPTPTATPTPAPTPPPGEVCVVSPTTLDFGSTDVATTVTLSTTVTHTGASGRCTVQATSFDNPEFSRLSPSVPFNVWAGTTRTITVQYAPVDAGADTNNMTITIRRPDGTTATPTVGLNGSGL